MMHFLGWPAAPALVFSVLIAATDPIAVIAMFKDTGIKGRLRLLVESESLFNDGVAAVLFALALTWAQAADGWGDNGGGCGARTRSHGGRWYLRRDCGRRGSHCAGGADFRPSG